MFNKSRFMIYLCIITLSGCTSIPAKKNSDITLDTKAKNTEQCDKIDPVNTSLLTSAIIGVITLNPIPVALVGATTYFTVNSGVFDCNSEE